MKTTKPLALNPVARALVPFHVAHLAAHRAYVCAHVAIVRAIGGAAAHRALTAPRFERARAALAHAIETQDANAPDVRAAAVVAEQILVAESKARHAGKTWDADAAVDAWRRAV